MYTFYRIVEKILVSDTIIKKYDNTMKTLGLGDLYGKRLINYI